MAGRVALNGGRSARGEVVATFTDRFGEEREIHKTRKGLRVREQVGTPILKLNRAIGELIGGRIKSLRLERGFSQRELAEAVGMRSGHPKARMHDIESGSQQEGIRLGTLYAFALALDVDPADLLPSTDEVLGLAGVHLIAVPEVKIK